jgi:putative ABC transport system permease protein
LIRRLRLAVRSLARSPALVAAAVTCLALGIGAATALYSVVDGVLLSALPFEDPDGLVALSTVSGDDERRGSFSTAELLDLREGARTLQAVAGLTTLDVTLTGAPDGGEPRRLVAGRVTGNLLPMLGVDPAVGRVFGSAEEQPGQHRVAVLSRSLADEVFGAGAGEEALERTLAFNSQTYTVLGILEGDPGVTIEGVPVRLFIAMPIDPEDPRARAARGVTLLARRAEGSSLDAVRAELDTMAQRWKEDFPRNYPDPRWGIRVVPLFEELVGSVRGALWLAFGVTALVLLIACANVAHLLLARAAARRRDEAVQIALGASRGDLLRGYLAEGLVLAGAGAVVGLALAWVAVRALVAVDPGDLPRLSEVSVDGPVALFAAAVALVSVLLFALAPGFRSFSREGGTHLAGSLKEGSKGSEGPGARWMRDGLVVAEVALGTLVLTGAALLLASFLRLQGEDPGFETDGRLSFELLLPPKDYPAPHQLAGFAGELRSGLASLPGVKEVGVTSIPPVQQDLFQVYTAFDNPRLAETDRGDLADWRAVSPGYFEASGIPIHAGRGFRAGDGDGAAPVAVIDRAVAERYFPGTDPLGRRLAVGGARPDGSNWRTIVGVVGHVRAQGPGRDTREQVYTPYDQTPMPFLTAVVHADRDPEALAPEARRVVSGLDPRLAPHHLGPLGDSVARTVATERFYAALLSAFALVAALLVAVGLYGITAYAVTRRRRELGIRLALGEERRSVLRRVLSRSGVLAAVGVALGLALALAGGRLVAALLYGVSPRDPLLLALVAAVLLALTFLSTLSPAVGASRIDPLSALREE